MIIIIVIITILPTAIIFELCNFRILAIGNYECIAIVINVWFTKLYSSVSNLKSWTLIVLVVSGMFNCVVCGKYTCTFFNYEHKNLKCRRKSFNGNSDTRKYIQN